MKTLKSILKFVVLCSVLFVYAPLAYGQEAIRSFQSVLEVKENGTVEVTETIGYDFDENERHGIYREIPLNYSFEDKRYAFSVRDIEINSLTEAPHTWSVEEQDQNVRIRIGDLDQKISGAHEYVITYTVGNALRAHEHTYELYWNATGNKWDVPTESAESIVILPGAIEKDEIRFACYEGTVGSTAECANVEAVTENGEITHVTASTEDLQAQEGLTIAVEFPERIISDYEHVPDKSNALLFLIVGAAGLLVVAGFMWWFWYRYGRDPEGRGLIVRQYDPPDGLTPAETGLIVDERVHDRDITAEIVSLARKGYIHILALPIRVFFFERVTYIIFRLKDTDDKLKKHEQLILDALFKHGNASTADEVMETVPQKTNIDKLTLTELIEKSTEYVALEDLEKSFHRDIRAVKKELFESFTDRGYFVRNPQDITKRFGRIAGFLFVLLWLLIFIRPFPEYVIIWLVFAYMFFVFVFSWYVLTLVRKTDNGVAAREHALGLKQYLSLAEKERMEFHFDPRKNPELFEKLLPYAIALRVEKQWAEQFEGIFQQEPSWYTSSGNEAFSSTAFASHLAGDLARSTSTSGSSSTGAGGGGFSGGGSGGGGGGSW